MATLWIVHRDPRAQRTLARLAGAPDDTSIGAPDDRSFESASPADIVLLGLAGDWETELEFAHRFAARHRGARWVLLAEPASLDDARRLFDTLHAEVLPFPIEASLLRRQLRSMTDARRGDSLSQRSVRDGVAGRFARWFHDLEIPELLRAVDPRMGDVSLLVRGEPGTGRALVVRYVHAFGGTTGGSLVHVPCNEDRTATQLLDEISRAALDKRQPRLCIWFEDIDALPASVQRQVANWIVSGLPSGVAGTGWIRWMATAGDDNALALGRSLDPSLEDALAGVCVQLPPLRERLETIQSFVEATASAWCARHGEAARGFTTEAIELLAENLWVGNLRELEAVIERSLAAGVPDPIPAAELRFSTADEVLPKSLERVEEVERMAARMRRDEADSSGPTPLRERRRPEVLRAEPKTPEPEPGGEAPTSLSAEQLQQLVGAIAHEVRNPLVAVRTFAELLPERFADAEFRKRAVDIVGADVRRIESVVERLSRFASLEAPVQPEPVDIAEILESVLEESRTSIQKRRLVVLRELDRDLPFALGDADQLRFALESLVGKALELVPDRGDLYLASKHHAAGLRNAASLRVLLRFRSPQDLTGEGKIPGVSITDTALEIAVAEAVVRSHGGTMSVGASDGRETVVVIDLPAPD